MHGTTNESAVEISAHSCPADFVRACAVEVHGTTTRVTAVEISATRARQILCEPAQSKCTSKISRGMHVL